MSESTFIKDPDETLDFRISWADSGANDGSSTDTGWLIGDTIVTSTWIVPAGITEVSESNNNTDAWIFLSGGTLGEKYRLTNRITTAQGRTADRSITIEIASK